ncbi:hypothetical protein WNY77_02570 [Paraglaciecola mesophila]|uniref:Uncharacterized protein n=1 Tax=Paraglaciecola mesophila TaxID=197222 RepID=A0ABU9SQY4_9ALTE
MSTIRCFFNLAVVYALRLPYELRPPMVFDHLCTTCTEYSFAAYELCSLMRVAYFMACGHLCTACTEHSFAAYLWPAATMRCAYLMSYAHVAQLRCLCATLIVISVTAPALLYLPPSMAVA